MTGEDFAKPTFLYGTATGIGSMPHLDQNEALRLVFNTLPHGPHWPQLPNRGRDEGFARQYLSALGKLGVLNTMADPPFFHDREPDWSDRLERFYVLCIQEEEGLTEKVLNNFAFPPGSADGFYAFMQEPWHSNAAAARYIKGQISGPLSLGLQINAGNGTAAFYDAELRDVITRTLTLIARWQVRTLKRHYSSVLIFIDEPALLSYGQSAYVSLSRDAIKESLGEVIGAIIEEGGYAGVHCCSGVDWSILFELPLHVVNFDAYSYLSSLLVYANELELFLKRGGCLGWGLVPTSQDVETENEELLLQKYFGGLERLVNKGVTKELLREQYLLTPSCGTATLSIAQAERVYGLLAVLQKVLAV